jgi:hypothetical protein
LTLRHTDWWFWEYDRLLSIDSEFVNACRFPDSVKEIRFELESLERKKDQIDFIAKEMANKWRFRRNDGTYLSAKHQPVDVMRWSGSSTWGGIRWVRDEAKPDTLDYYVATLTFVPIPNTPRADEDAEEWLNCKLEVTDKPVIFDHTPYLNVSELDEAGVMPGTPAEDVRKMLKAWRDEEARRNYNLRFGIPP